MACFHIPYQLVQPKAWQASAGFVAPSPRSAADFADRKGRNGNDRTPAQLAAYTDAQNKKAHKRALMEHAKRRWPQLPIKAEDDWGLGDAAMMATAPGSCILECRSRRRSGDQTRPLPSGPKPGSLGAAPTRKPHVDNARIRDTARELFLAHVRSRDPFSLNLVSATQATLEAMKTAYKIAWDFEVIGERFFRKPPELSGEELHRPLE